MPRSRTRSLFELGGQWIAEEPGKRGLYRFWLDAGIGRTRRASLGTTDLGAAKLRLAEIVLKGERKTPDHHLTLILETYFEERTDHLASKKVARHAGKLLLQCFGPLVRVSAFDQHNNKRFVEWSLSRGHSLTYAARNLGVLAAALAHSKLIVDVVYSEGAILAKWPHLKPKPAREVFEPSDEELARLLLHRFPRICAVGY